jgi:hypothetical protein
MPRWRRGLLLAFAASVATGLFLAVAATVYVLTLDPLPGSTGHLRVLGKH